MILMREFGRVWFGFFHSIRFVPLRYKINWGSQPLHSFFISLSFCYLYYSWPRSQLKSSTSAIIIIRLKRTFYISKQQIITLARLQGCGFGNRNCVFLFPSEVKWDEMKPYIYHNSGNHYSTEYVYMEWHYACFSSCRYYTLEYE